MHRPLVALVAGFFAVCEPVMARPGELDRTYSGDGLARIVTPADESVPAQIAVDDAGRSLVLLSGARVIRVTARGRLDRSWGRDGVVQIPQPGADGNGRPAGIAALPDGRTVVLTSVTLGRFVVARLTHGGQLDPTFDGDGVVELDPQGYARALDGVVVLRDGAVRVAMVRSTGRSGWIDPAPPELLAVGLDPHGGADPRFGNAGLVRIPTAGRGPAFAWDPGRLLAAPGGSLVAVAGVATPFVARLDAAGRVLATREALVPGTSYDGADAAVDARGRIVLWGGDGPTLLRLRPDLSIDPAFQARRLPRSAGIRPEVLVAGGRVLLAGSAMIGKRFTRVAAVLALDDRGKLDRGFGRAGRTLLRLRGRPVGGPSMALDPFGRLMVAADFGDGLSSIRDDFGRDDPLLARLRLTDPPLDVRGTTARVSPRGTIALRLLCRGPESCAGTVRISGGGLHERRQVVLLSESRRTVAIRVGRRARSLASRGRFVTVALRGPNRHLPHDAVDRRVRLVRR